MCGQWRVLHVPKNVTPLKKLSFTPFTFWPRPMSLSCHLFLVMREINKQIPHEIMKKLICSIWSLYQPKIAFDLQVTGCQYSFVLSSIIQNAAQKYTLSKSKCYDHFIIWYDRLFLFLFSYWKKEKKEREGGGVLISPYVDESPSHVAFSLLN